jgi:hypothetical protein
VYGLALLPLEGFAQQQFVETAALIRLTLIWGLAHVWANTRRTPIHWTKGQVAASRKDNIR